ncbi:MAG: error-prone DNA polymerase, partial [Planctomycetota bacterium]|nr:error-prone DNA polymerase [Planctomycetota bacterium]
MPENEFQKVKPHPAKAAGADRAAGGVRAVSAPGYCELAVTSNYTFLTGASHPEELVERAASLGHVAAGIADTNTLAGVVRAHAAGKEAGIAVAIGCRVVMQDAPAVIVYPASRAGYGRLCRLLTRGKRRAPKGECHLSLDDLLDHREDLLGIVEAPERTDESFVGTLRVLREAFDDDRLSLAVSVCGRAEDARRLGQMREIGARARVALVGTNRVLYHAPERRALQDVLTCIRLGCTIEEAGLRLEANAERHLKAGDEMARLLRACPGAAERSGEIASRACAFNLDQVRYEYPAEACPPGLTPAEYLAREAWAGAGARYPRGVPEKTRRSLEHELGLISELRYEAYFLTCYDIVRFARKAGILCQGRGGAANSAVCYCLGITEVDPATHSLLFERFVSRARGEPPDIDIDFEHERREEVLQYIYETYGRDRAALTAEVITYRGRSAVREVGKALGLPPDCVDALAKNLDRWGEGASEQRVREIGLNPRDATIARVIALSGQLIGFPRHLSQHVGGFVITQGSLCDLVPIENAAMEDRTVIEWDKDDIDAMGMLKIDCLGLGMLTCIRKSFELLEGVGVRGAGGGRLTIADVRSHERSDDAVYDMICRADTVGVFQIESRAQIATLPRMQPKCFYDLVVEVAIIRPGPIVGKLVHPYLKRRKKLEEPECIHPAFKDVLERTLGVPLFQEQVLQMAMIIADFSGSEAEELRRAMSFHRSEERMEKALARLRAAMTARSVEPAIQQRIVDSIKSFALYGFPESHAISFAFLAYFSVWLKVHRPVEFYTALLNCQPMGFYSTSTLVRDAKKHGLRILPVCVVHSDLNCTVMSDDTLRLGLKQLRGISRGSLEVLATQRAQEPWADLDDLLRRCLLSRDERRVLAEAGAFNALGHHRRSALWKVEAAPIDDLLSPLEAESVIPLHAMTSFERMAADYRTTKLTVGTH